MRQDRFGNYIVQRVIETSTGAEKDEVRNQTQQQSYVCFPVHESWLCPADIGLEHLL